MRARTSEAETSNVLVNPNFPNFPLFRAPNYTARKARKPLFRNEFPNSPGIGKLRKVVVSAL